MNESAHPARILVIEDDRNFAEPMVYTLRQAGFEVLQAFDGRDGLNQAQLRLPDIILLDLNIPVIDGYEVCRRLRSDPATRDMIILMLTCRAEEADELVGFSLGADDYLTKPCSMKVLLERIKAVQRRARGSEASQDEVSASQGVQVDRRRHRVTVNGRPVQLTRSEFRLLDTLIRQPGRVFNRTELIDSALGEDTMVMERTIDVHIRALRRKLEGAADLIETVRGVGYRFRDPEQVETAEEHVAS